ncbi:MAG: hypothetical protein ACYTEQ_12275 [Planctomycetota bacterium]|jgi:hypothetical protein
MAKAKSRKPNRFERLVRAELQELLEKPQLRIARMRESQKDLPYLSDDEAKELIRLRVSHLERVLKFCFTR